MISEIAPIVAYLKYIVDNDEVDIQNNRFRISSLSKSKRSYLLFIEEPEAHLHPEVQIKLMEVFCKLVDMNIKIIMTTHSNYMFNKLSNLILGSKIAYDRIGSYLIISTNQGSVIDPMSMKADEEGINDENFADIAESLYNERVNIYQELNKD